MNSYYEKILATGEVKCIDEEVPFEIPKGWEWCRLNEVATSVTDFVASGSFASLRENVKYYSTKEYALLVRTKDLSCNFSKDLVYTDKHGYDFLSNSNLFGGELILPNIGASIGKVFIVPNLNMPMTLAPNSVMIRLDDECTKSWLYNVFSSPFGYDTLWSISSSTAQGKFNKTDFRKVLVPIPPIEEQNRIVTKIKELSPYIEKYSKAQEHLDVWNVAIKEILQKSILQEAIQGKLVPQIAEEGTAQELLEQIKAEKQKLVKEGKLKKSALNDSVIFRGDDNKYYEQIGKSIKCIDDETPFEIPYNWQWTRLSYISSIYTGNSISEAEKRAKFMGVQGRYYIGTKDVGFDNKIVYDNGISIPLQYERDFRLAPANSILMCIEGGSAGKKIAVLNQDVCFGNKLCCFSPFMKIGKLIYYYLQSPSFIDLFNQNKTGIIGGVSIAKVKDIVIPLPPLMEQQRIVAQIDGLFEQLR